jgi:hypothetical protein
MIFEYTLILLSGEFWSLLLAAGRKIMPKFFIAGVAK